MRIPRAFTVAFLLLMGVAMAATAKDLKSPPPDYFPLQVGDWWKYRWTSGGKSDEYTVKVVKTEKQPDGSTWYLTETVSPSQVIQTWYSKAEGWVWMHRMAYPKNNMTGEYAPVRKYLQNPPRAFTRWEWKGTGMMGVEIEEKNEVMESFDKRIMVVPAGKFVVVEVNTDTMQGGSPVKKVYWFANGIGLVKSITSSGGIDSTTELVDYSFKSRGK